MGRKALPPASLRPLGGKLIFGGEEISIPETRPLQKFYILQILSFKDSSFTYLFIVSVSLPRGFFEGMRENIFHIFWALHKTYNKFVCTYNE
jgi:hypothetical protein